MYLTGDIVQINKIIIVFQPIKFSKLSIDFYSGNMLSSRTIFVDGIMVNVQKFQTLTFILFDLIIAFYAVVA